LRLQRRIVSVPKTTMKTAPHPSAQKISASADTVLAGDLGQAALSGALNRIQTLGLELAGLRHAGDDASLGRARRCEVSGNAAADQVMSRRIKCSKNVGAVGFEPTKPLACKAK
jgi:hypothetical protein